MKLKKLVSLLFAVTMISSLSARNNNDKKENDNKEVFTETVAVVPGESSRDRRGSGRLFGRVYGGCGKFRERKPDPHDKGDQKGNAEGDERGE